MELDDSDPLPPPDKKSKNTMNNKISTMLQKLYHWLVSLVKDFVNPVKKSSANKKSDSVLHIVCSPGGGAFSVYMFVRYALAQHAHFNINVKMTMLCSEEEDGTILAEKWWNLWRGDDDVRQCLEIPGGWAPQFLLEGKDEELSKDLSCKTEIFILAGGSQSRLVKAYRCQKEKKEDNQRIVLLTEEELVEYSKGEFAFRPAFDNEIGVLPDKHNLKPQESLIAVEKAHNAKLDELLNSPKTVESRPKFGKRTQANQGKFSVYWEKDIQFFENEPTRLVVNVRPKISDIEVSSSLEYSDILKVKAYVKDHIDEWFNWRKSLRFKLEEKFDKRLDDFFTRRPDARKLFMYNAAGEKSPRAKNYSVESLLFSHYKEATSNQSTTTELIIMAWDSRNIGRSTQLLSQSLETLENNQNLLLLDFSDGKDGNRTPQSSLIIKSLEGKGGQLDMYKQDLETLEIINVTTNTCLESECFSSFLLSTIGMNGPSLKEIIDSIDLSKDLQLLGERDVGNQSINLEPLSVHRAFIRGIFPTIPLGERHLKMEDFEYQWLRQVNQIKYITWVKECDIERENYLPYHLICTMDSTGKVLHVFDAKKQNVALEVLLYIALFNIENVQQGRFFTSSPNPTGFETKTMFNTTDLDDLEFPNKGATQNAEIWFTELNDAKFRHFVGDAKAITHMPESDALDKAEVAFTSLTSKYNWKTLHGHIRVVMLSFFGGNDGSRTNDNPFIFSKQIYKQIKEKKLQKPHNLIYSIKVDHFSNYIKSFFREYQDDVNPISFQEYESSIANGQPNLDAPLPFHQSKSIPKKTQTSLHIFRKNLSSIDKSLHSGYFFNNESYDFQNAFYFHNKSLKEIAIYFLRSQDLEESDRVQEISHLLNLEALFDFIKKIAHSKQDLAKSTKSRNFSALSNLNLPYGFNNDIIHSKLNDDEHSILTRLIQITKQLNMESPILMQPDRELVLTHLSEWASLVVYKLHSTAEESLVNQSQEVNHIQMQQEVNKLFSRASEKARREDDNAMKSLREFFSDLEKFCSSISPTPKTRYKRYKSQKIKLASRSSQSDA